MIIPNTFRLKAEAITYIAIESEEALIEALKKYKDPFILGGGSNMLLTKDITQPVFHILIKGIEVVEETDSHIWIKANAGEPWHQFVQYTLAQGYGGLENLSLIYGNVGATPVQNIGAYGVEIKDVMESCEAIAIETCEKHIFSNVACHFGYRESIFKGAEKGKYIITSVTFKLTKKEHILHTRYGAIEEALKKMQVEKPTPIDIARAVISIREQKLPNPAILGNCGSFFKNPIILKTVYEELLKKYPSLPCYAVDDTQVKVPAGWLIEHCGLKGYREGDAGVHSDQALVLVNYGNATGEEILGIANKVKAKVKEIFGISLAFEVNIF